MRALLASLGLDAEFVSAVDGRRLTSEQRALYDSPRTRRVYGCDMSDSEIACYLSHFSLYERMAAEGIELALILEDDLECVPDFKALVSQLAAQKNPEWGVVHLQTCKTSVAKPHRRAERGAAISRVGRRHVHRIATSVLGVGAYLVRLSAAEAMLTHGQRIFMPIDQTLDRYWENGVLPYVVRPIPTWQAPRFDSQIGLRGRKARSANFSTIVQRKVQRAADSIAKRVFWISLKAPQLGAALALLRVPPARIARRTRERLPTHRSAYRLRWLRRRRIGRPLVRRL